jgi:hypothetical protein
MVTTSGLFNLAAVWILLSILFSQLNKKPSSLLRGVEYLIDIGDVIYCWIHFVVIIPGGIFILHHWKYSVAHSNESWRVSLQDLIIEKCMKTWLILSICSGSFAAWNRAWLAPQTMFYLAEILILTMKMVSFWSQENIDRNNSKAEHPVPLGHFVRFILAPTLIFAREYPSRKSIRKEYLLKKLMAFATVWGLAHFLVGDWILPTMVNAPSLTFLEFLSETMVPIMLVQWLLFFLVFEIVLNAFAEITQFGDREFYSEYLCFDLI